MDTPTTLYKIIDHGHQYYTTLNSYFVHIRQLTLINYTIFVYKMSKFMTFSGYFGLPHLIIN